MSVVPESVRFTMEENDQDRICRILQVDKVPSEILDWARRFKFFSDRDGESKVTRNFVPTVTNMIPYICSLFDMGMLKAPAKKTQTKKTQSNASASTTN